MSTYGRTVIRIVAALILVSLPLLGESPKAESPPSSDSAFFQSSNASLIESLKLKQPNKADVFEGGVIAIVQALNQSTGLTTNVWLCHGCGTSSHPTLGIILDVDQLLAMEAGPMSVRGYGYLLIFVLAHEEIHQAQYHVYSPAIIQSPDEERMVYEAQADILAAKYLALSAKITTKTINANYRALEDTIRVAFELGTERYALADHPSQGERSTAVAIGLMAGLHARFVALDPTADWGELVGYPEPRPGESTMAWSMEMSRKIVNYRRSASVDLVQVAKTIHWDKSAANPIVSYDLIYENRGDKGITVDLDVQSSWLIEINLMSCCSGKFQIQIITRFLFRQKDAES